MITSMNFSVTKAEKWQQQTCALLFHFQFNILIRLHVTGSERASERISEEWRKEIFAKYIHTSIYNVCVCVFDGSEWLYPCKHIGKVLQVYSNYHWNAIAASPYTQRMFIRRRERRRRRRERNWVVFGRKKKERMNGKKNEWKRKKTD